MAEKFEDPRRRMRENYEGDDEKPKGTHYGIRGDFTDAEIKAAEIRAAGKKVGAYGEIIGPVASVAEKKEAKKVAEIRKKIAERPDQKTVDRGRRESVPRVFAEMERSYREGAASARNKPASRPVFRQTSDRKSANAEDGTTRRGFIKKLIIWSAGFLTVKHFLKKLFSDGDRYEADEALEEERLTPEQMKKIKKNREIFNKIFKYKRGKYYEYGEDQEKIQDEFWRNECLEDKQGIKESYFRVKYWEKFGLREVFDTHFIAELEKYESLDAEKKEDLYWDYLAQVIRESGGDPDIVSPAGAVGMHQFMADVAREEGLRVDKFVDERTDPIKSEKAYCSLMMKFYLRYGRNLNLARQGYNGVVGWYWIECEKNGNNMTEEGLNEFIERDLNSKDFFHEVEKGDTVGKIAACYKISKNELLVCNPGIQDASKIFLGQMIRLPDTKSVDRIFFGKKADKYYENTNYLWVIRNIKKVLLEMEENGELSGESAKVLAEMG